MKGSEERLGKLAGDLESSLGKNLVSVILYGSAARGEHAGKGSDYNVMVIVEDGSPRLLEPVAQVQKRWQKEGNPPLLFVTAEWIRNSTDVFPLEFMDMVDARRVLVGADPLEGVTVAPSHLRHQCEREVRSLVLKLRAAYLDARDRASHLMELIRASFGSVAAVSRAALRLAGREVPPHSDGVMRELAARYRLDGAALGAALEIKRGRKVTDLDEARRIFLGYFDQIAALARALDTLADSPGGSAAGEHRQ